MPGTDAMLDRLNREVQERTAFQQQLTDIANKEGRDLTPGEMELYDRAASRLAELEPQISKLADSARITYESNRRMAEMQQWVQPARREEKPRVEYRSAGQWLLDKWQASKGDEDAANRIEWAQRVADHQTTADNPGLLPQSVIGPLINIVDQSRPIVSMLNVTDPGQGSWAYPKVTQHTSVAVQSAEKAELASQAMTISLTTITPATYGGYVNLSAQNLYRSTPGILDIIVNDLAGQYAIATENAAADALYAAATAGTNTAVVAASTADDITAALWTVVGQSYTAMQGAGTLFLAISPDLLGLFGPAFGPAVQIEATAPSTGFTLQGFGSGVIGNISGVPVVVSAGMNSNRAMIVNTAAARVFEHRYGTLQVVEPSVAGMQVAYAGDFVVVETVDGGIVTVDTVA